MRGPAALADLRQRAVLPAKDSAVSFDITVVKEKTTSGGNPAQSRTCITSRQLFCQLSFVPTCINYSVITWSAHSTSETKMGGLPNFAP
jgi:hypothetical protein